nr:unnamed protein product [Digitaria exilis]
MEVEVDCLQHICLPSTPVRHRCELAVGCSSVTCAHGSLHCPKTESLRAAPPAEPALCPWLVGRLRFHARTQSRAADPCHPPLLRLGQRWSHRIPSACDDGLSSRLPRAMPLLCINDGLPRHRSSTELVRRQAVQQSEASMGAAKLHGGTTVRDRLSLSGSLKKLLLCLCCQNPTLEKIEATWPNVLPELGSGARRRKPKPDMCHETREEHGRPVDSPFAKNCAFVATMQRQEVVEEVVIVGAGLAGLATALGLHRSLVLESSPALRTAGFAFTAWRNAFRALDALGVGDKIREQHLQAQAYVLTLTKSLCLRRILLRRLQAACHVFVYRGREEQVGLQPPDHALYSDMRADVMISDALNDTDQGPTRSVASGGTPAAGLPQALEEELPRGTIRYSSRIVSIEEDGDIMRSACAIPHVVIMPRDPDLPRREHARLRPILQDALIQEANRK